MAIDIVENHEYKHLQDKLKILNRRRAAAEELEQKTFPSKARCMYECNKWKLDTDAEAVRAQIWRDFLKNFGIR